MANIAAWGTIGISTRASPGSKDGGAIYRPTHRDVEITPERMPSILDKRRDYQPTIRREQFRLHGLVRA
jgi:hypothetical protein